MTILQKCVRSYIIKYYGSSVQNWVMKRLQNANALHCYTQFVFPFSQIETILVSLRYYYKVCCFDEGWTLIVVVPENDSAVIYCSMIIWRKQDAMNVRIGRQTHLLLWTISRHPFPVNSLFSFQSSESFKNSTSNVS